MCKQSLLGSMCSLCLTFALSSAAGQTSSPSKPVPAAAISSEQSTAKGGLIRPRVLVITTYETGKDTGDVPGELQFWAERNHLTQSIAIPGLLHPLLTDGHGLYAMVSGVTSRSALQLMTLALSPQVDLTHTYILLSGIGGANPEHVTVGSAVWVTAVLDGDPAYEIDSREIPAAWPYGTIALGATEPGTVPANVDDVPAAGVSVDGSGGVGKIVFPLNAQLVDWAFQLTRSYHLTDTAALQAQRARYQDPHVSSQTPSVMEGVSLGTDHFWHGAIFNHWAADWVRLYTRNKSTLAISDCEDQGILLAADQLDRLHRIDMKRLLVLRTASNFTVPPPEVSAEKDLFDDLSGSPGYLPSLEAAYQVGNIVVSDLLAHWDRYESQIP